MKKGLLLSLTLLAVSIVFAQQHPTRFAPGFHSAKLPASYNKAVRLVRAKDRSIDNGVPYNNSAPSTLAVPARHLNPGNTSNLDRDEAKIGYTGYDLQTNGSVSSRLSNNGDGSFSAVWTFSPDADLAGGFLDRGTGYNYFDQQSQAWIFPDPGPDTRIENVRTGFPNIAVTINGEENVIAHTGTAMAITRRTAKGTGAWSNTDATVWGTANNDTWPKTAVDGETVYAVWQGSGVSTVAIDGQDGPIFFTKSTDGGATWTPKAIITEIDSDFYLGFGGDDYSIDARNGVVAIAFAGTTNDVGLLKSTDGGQTWTKTIIHRMPIPMFDANSNVTDTNGDGIIDTLNTNGGDVHVLVDNGTNMFNGSSMCHVWWSDYRWYRDSATTAGSYFYLQDVDGMEYWNETMPTEGYVTIATAQDFNNNGVLDVPTEFDTTCGTNAPWGYYRISITGMPSAGQVLQGSGGAIYVTYQTIDEAADTAIHIALHHSYIISTTDAGQTWTYPFDIVDNDLSNGVGSYSECVFPSIARLVDPATAYVLYQRDQIPGLLLGPANGCDAAHNAGNTNDMIFVKLDAVAVGINTVNSNDISVGQNYPNPVNGMTSVNVRLKNSSSYKLEVTDIAGRVIYTENQPSISAGLHTINMNTASWNSGVYLYTVTIDGKRFTRQMIVQ